MRPRGTTPKGNWKLSKRRSNGSRSGCLPTGRNSTTSRPKPSRRCKDRRHFRTEPVVLEQGPGPNREEAQKRFDEAAREARAEYDRLNKQVLARLLSGMGIVWVGLLLWLVPFGVLAGLVQPEWIGLKNLSPKAWALVSAGVTFALSFLVLMVTWFIACAENLGGVRAVSRPRQRCLSKLQAMAEVRQDRTGADGGNLRRAARSLNSAPRKLPQSLHPRTR